MVNRPRNFRSTVDSVTKTLNPLNPEGGLAFSEDYILDMYKSNNIKVDVMQYGRWARQSGPYGQDIIIGYHEKT